LTPWEKLAIILLGGGLIGISLLLVVCFVCPTCLFYRIFNKEEKEFDNGFAKLRLGNGHHRYPSPNRSYYDAYSTSSDCEDSISKFHHVNGKNRKRVNPFKSKSMETLSLQANGSETSDSKEHRGEKRTLGGVGDSKSSYKVRNSNDSTYGSIASSSSGRASPANMSILSSTLSTLSLPFAGSSKSKNAADVPPTVLRMTLKLEKTEEGRNILLINLLNVSDMPRRSYCFARDSFAVITISKEKSFFTGRKSRKTVAEKKTNQVKRNLNPNYNFHMSTDIDVEDVKSYKVKVVLYDHDKNTRLAELGSTTIPLKTVKSALVSKDENVLDFSLCLKMKPKEELGSIVFELSYLPTAQRLSFSIVKATNLRYESLVNDLELFEPFVQILQVNPSGKVLRKKRSKPIQGSRDPLFNETLNFELAPNYVEFMSFVVEICCLVPQMSEENEMPAQRPIEKCLGHVSIGKNVNGEKERALFYHVMTAPRNAFLRDLKLE